MKFLSEVHTRNIIISSKNKWLLSQEIKFQIWHNLSRPICCADADADADTMEDLRRCLNSQVMSLSDKRKQIWNQHFTSSLHTVHGGKCVCVCVFKSLGAQKQTNKAHAAVIKPSLVLVMHSGAAERQTSLSSLADRGQKPRPAADPCSGHPGALCVSTSAATYRKMSV